MGRTVLISRIAIAIGLAAGAVTALPAPAVAKKAEKAGGQNYSDAFRKAAAPVQKAITDATAGAQGNQTPEQLAAIKAKIDAALGGNADAALAEVEAAATTPDDKLAFGSMLKTYGVITQNQSVQLKGLGILIASGALPPEEVGKDNFDAGVNAYQLADYATAARYFKAAKDAGFHDPQGLLDQVLADSYKRSGNAGAVTDMAAQDLAAARAAGTKPSETSIRTALEAAYNAKNLATSTDLAVELVRDYPVPTSWATSVGVVRQLSQPSLQDALDFMRLQARASALQSRNDYLTYVEVADPHRVPAEVLKIVNAGVASGKLSAADAAEPRQIATERLPADQASLAGLEHDAHAGNASAQVASGAGDAFLAHDQAAKAEELYKIALDKPGVVKDRVLTRLGIAQVDQGKYADAKASFAQVGGTRVQMAKLWLAYVDTKTGAAPAPAQASAQKP